MSYSHLFYSHISGTSTDWDLGQVRLGVLYIIICWYDLKFDWLQLVTVVRKLVPCPLSVMVSVTKSRDTQNCIQMISSMRSGSFSPSIYITKPRTLIIYDLLWQITYNYNRLDDDHCDGPGHRKMAVLDIAGDLETTHENSWMVCSLKGPTFFGDGNA